MAKVLIADDDVLLMQLLNHKLASNGFEVIQADNGETALGLAREKCPDVIVLDAMMPVMDGFETLRRIGKEPSLKGVPVIMLTARKQEQDVLHGLSLGAAEYLVKPFSPDELVARLKRAMEAAAQGA